MVTLRSGRGEELEDIPHHYEGIGLRSHVLLAGWPLATAATVGGVAAMVLAADGSVGEAVGGLLAAVGVVLLFGLVRCRRVELTVGGRWLHMVNGPFRQKAPVGLIEEMASRRAGAWRQLYAADEVVLSLGMGRHLAVPTRQPFELLEAITLETRE